MVFLAMLSLGIPPAKRYLLRPKLNDSANEKASAQLRKEQLDGAIRNGQIPLDPVVTRWGANRPGVPDNRLNIEAWVKNNSQYDATGVWVFKIVLDHSRLRLDYLKERVAPLGDLLVRMIARETGRSAQEIEADHVRCSGCLDATDKAFAEFVRRGREGIPGLDYEPVFLEPGDPKTFDALFRVRYSLRAGEVGKVEYNLEVPPTEEGYVVKAITLDRVEPH